MAIKIEELKFLINQLSNPNRETYKSIVSQIFNYLEKEVKDNPIYDNFVSDFEKWSDWPNGQGLTNYGGTWVMPYESEDAKSLAFYIYNQIAKNEPNFLDSLSLSLFREKRYLDGLHKLNSTFGNYFIKSIEKIISASSEIIFENDENQKRDMVFIIHGHDNELKTEVQLLLERAGVNNVVLHERPDKGRTIIDKLIEEASTAAYAIALLTPDDLTSEGENRARQNVILEIGYFIGKIGKSRVRMIVKDDIDIPSDLKGILYEKHDTNGNWKIKLLKEIMASGIYVDLNNVVSKS